MLHMVLYFGSLDGSRKWRWTGNSELDILQVCVGQVPREQFHLVGRLVRVHSNVYGNIDIGR